MNSLSVLPTSQVVYQLITHRKLWSPLRNEQICNRSVLAKTDYLQTNLSSAESVFSLLQTVSLNTLRNSETADEKQSNNRSADYLQRLQMICNTVKSKNRVDRPFIVS